MGGWLITRPRVEAERTARAVRAAGLDAAVAPVLRPVLRRPDRDAAEVLAGAQAILLTSPNGVRGWSAVSTTRDLPVLAVGDRTADMARQAGFRHVRSADGDAADLAELVVRSLAIDRGHILHPTTRGVGRRLAQRLSSVGFDLRPLWVYDVRPVPVLPPAAATALADTATSGVAFFSPRSAKVFVTLAERAGLAHCLRRLTAVCMSRAVADRLGKGAWRDSLVAARPTLEAMIAEMHGAIRA